jgi:hypothetical protein
VFFSTFSSSDNNMPTLTLSWTDLALFGLTAGLIGGIVLIGRSNSSPNVTAPNNQKKGAAPKKKKKAKKGGEPISSPPLFSPSAKRRESSGQSPAPTQPITTPESHPEPPPVVQSQAVEAERATGPSAAQPQKVPKKKAGKKAADTINDQDFPPLAAAKDESNNKSNQNKPKRPFAERHQQPVRKTIVDDMSEL